MAQKYERCLYYKEETRGKDGKYLVILPPKLHGVVNSRTNTVFTIPPSLKFLASYLLRINWM